MHFSLLCCPLSVTTLKTGYEKNFLQTCTNKTSGIKNSYKKNFIQNKATKIGLYTKYGLKGDL